MNSEWFCEYYIDNQLLNKHKIAVEHAEIVCSRLKTSLCFGDKIEFANESCLEFCWYMSKLGYYLRYITEPFYKYIKTSYEIEEKPVLLCLIRNDVTTEIQGDG